MAGDPAIGGLSPLLIASPSLTGGACCLARCPRLDQKAVSVPKCGGTEGETPCHGTRWHPSTPPSRGRQTLLLCARILRTPFTFSGGFLVMTQRGLVCLLLGALSWGQAAKPSVPASSKPAAPAATHPATTPSGGADEQAPAKAESNVAPDAVVITIPGACDKPAADANSADC